MPEELGQKNPEVRLLPSESLAEDIFAGLDTSQKPSKEKFKKERRKFPFKVLVVILIVIIIGTGGFLVYNQRAKFNFLGKIFKPKPKIERETPAPQLKTETPSVPVVTEIDTDGDGLPDPEETILGTDLQKVDTDNDGLTDKEEVKIYKTNPLNPDTDSDNLSDGYEVRQGLDPRDPSPEAKLLDLQVEVEKIQ